MTAERMCVGRRTSSLLASFAAPDLPSRVAGRDRQGGGGQPARFNAVTMRWKAGAGPESLRGLGRDSGLLGPARRRGGGRPDLPVQTTPPQGSLAWFKGPTTTIQVALPENKLRTDRQEEVPAFGEPASRSFTLAFTRRVVRDLAALVLAMQHEATRREIDQARTGLLSSRRTPLSGR